MSADSVAQDLQAFVRRIESLEDEITALNGDKSEVYKEAKGNGFDTKVLRKVIADRRKDATERNEFDAVYQLYWDAIHGVVRAHVENIDEFGSRAKAAHAVSREEDAGERQHSSNSGKAGADEPGRQTSASADADPALNPRASRNGVDGTSEGQGATGAGTEGASPSTGATIYEPGAMRPQAGATAERDLTTGHTPTWPLTPADAGQVAPIHEPDAAMRPQTGAVETLVANSEAADLATVPVAETALVPRVAAASEPITHRSAAA